jgi:hypothetical protein
LIPSTTKGEREREREREKERERERDRETQTETEYVRESYRINILIFLSWYYRRRAISAFIQNVP